jgi:hypothetical protein
MPQTEAPAYAAGEGTPPPPGRPLDLNGLAAELVGELVRGQHEQYGYGSMTCAVYDTAWVAMVKRPGDDSKGSPDWLFPSSFSLLLETQQADGGWGPAAMKTDGILNTAAALLALCRHRQFGPAVPMAADQLDDRIAKGTAYLREQLQVLDVGATLPVGFEMILPTLLGLLSEHDITVDFAARPALFKLRAKKLAYIDLESMYNGAKSTALHSLEAFIGTIDFDRVAHHKTLGSMMASPSSTAAYLMNCSTWDVEAEQYLRQVVEGGAGKGSGGVPSAYPSTYFEYNWVSLFQKIALCCFVSAYIDKFRSFQPYWTMASRQPI